MKKIFFIVVMSAILLSNCMAAEVDYSALAPVQGGTFDQTDGKSSFTHTISPFKMGKYEVTYELWYKVYRWAINHGYTFANAGWEGKYGKAGAAPTAAKHEPVTRVNWWDAIVWCNAYSEKSGLQPVYCLDAGFKKAIKDSKKRRYGCDIEGAKDSPEISYVNWNANGYRLPTEGEWQYAASYIDGSKWTPYNYASGADTDYNNEAATGLVAWFLANAEYVTHDAGGKKANALGIYDMSGNVYEWCWDWYDEAYPGASTDYRGPARGEFRVLRGGGYRSTADILQVGHRHGNGPCYAFSLEDFGYGFRVARTH